ncbi:MAG: chemotaxis protein CheW [Spirochaetales bacterium]|nr:chemotaxis protein CheW [Spirochaetales bacterium]
MVEVDNKIQLVTFQLGNEKYGIDIMDVKEIVQMKAIRPIPNAPIYVAGILNLRSMIYPIIDLHRRFRIEKPELSEDDELLSGFVIISVEGRQIGIIIDKVSRVVPINTQDVQPPPKVISGIGTEYIKGVISDEGEYLIILDIHKLFDPRELQQLDRLSR